jgi:hypothetical protein
MEVATVSAPVLVLPFIYSFVDIVFTNFVGDWTHAAPLASLGGGGGVAGDLAMRVRGLVFSCVRLRLRLGLLRRRLLRMRVVWLVLVLLVASSPLVVLPGPLDRGERGPTSRNAGKRSQPTEPQRERERERPYSWW